jgi:hypothetical protein
MDSSMTNPRGISDRLMVAAALLTAGTTFYLVALSIYRIYFHPLAKFPGPKLNAISDVSDRVTFANRV